MRQTEDFIQACKDAKKWIASKSPDYDAGVDILIRSGFKRNLATRLKKIGQQDWTVESLFYSLQELIKISNPDAAIAVAEPKSATDKVNKKSKLKTIIDDIKQRIL
jgi:hypothetical protein